MTRCWFDKTAALFLAAAIALTGLVALHARAAATDTGSASASTADAYFRAIKQNNAAAMTALLRQGANPNTVDARGIPGLYMALQDESLEVASALLASPKINVNLLAPTDESPLMMAALKGQADIARQLIAKGAAINKSGWTPLHYAATGGHAELIKLLLKAGADLDARSPNDSTPLMMAARYGSAESVRLLLKAGADPHARNHLGMDALDFALSASRPDAIEILGKLRKTGGPSPAASGVVPSDTKTAPTRTRGSW
ncbi:MAG: ankyrin repeat domain-containing protein [Burkholderiaceae bacterium]|jgi:ankyrin repeat protein|nr:ankyrin repeat domain-containing protein [Burkholderiaceae bacterium]